MNTSKTLHSFQITDSKISAIKKSPLFGGIHEKDITTLLSCLLAQEKHFEKNTFIFRTDEKITAVGILLSGKVHIIKEDFWGNRMILTQLDPGDLFGESFSCAELEGIPVNVVATEPSNILFIDYHKIITSCSSVCNFHTQLIHNMLKILAGKNIALTQKIEHITMRTTRDKLLSYLSSEAINTGNTSFEIPFNRQELADYLSVDRSAMSNELGKMRDEGILKFHRNHFEMIQL